MEEYFDYLNMRFDLTKARLLSQDAKYSPKTAKPKASWLAPFINIADCSVVDLSQVVLFATLLYEVKPMHLLIEGNELVKWPLEHDTEVTFKILDLPDTTKVMSDNPATIRTRTRRLKLYEQ